MDWDEKQQARFDELRQRELTGSLTPAEQSELDTLIARLTQAADEALSPAVARLQIEQAELQERLQRRQHENEELAKLLHQQEQLVAESQRWLADFDRRHAQIREAYTRLTFVHPAVDELVNLQDVKGQAKPYQVRQFLKLVERYNLKLEEN